MNKAILVGNLTKDPEKRSTPNGVSVTTFTVAVQRRMKNSEGRYDADFINVVAWRSTADFVAKYFSKGSRIGVVGSIQTRSYDDKNGNRRYVTEVVADEVEFAGSKSSGGDSGYGAQREAKTESQPTADDLFGDEISDFEPIPDPELPF